MSPAACHIREYNPGHESDVVDLMADLQDHEKGYSADRPEGLDMASDHFRYLVAECENKQGRIFVAEADGSLVGFVVVMVESMDDDDGHVYERYKNFAEVTDLFVRNEFRGQGIAAALLGKVERHCLDIDVRRIKVPTLAANQEARGFYRRRGYREYEVTYCKDL